MKFAAKAQSDECAPKRPLDPAELLRPPILDRYKLQVFGPPYLLGSTNISDDVSIFEDSHSDPMWSPSETLARISCRELYPIPETLVEKRENLHSTYPELWWELAYENSSSNFTEKCYTEPCYSNRACRQYTTCDTSP